MANSISSVYGVVAIGRNEGDRLKQCLSSLSLVSPLIYVDSGSTDGSANLARNYGAEVVELDASRRFTAARARNAGYKRLLEIRPDLQFIQFIDGDCELIPQWLELASSFLAAHEQVGAVFGRRRERYPTLSVYNQLCDWEWDGPIGEGASFGGDVMIRTSALVASGGYREDVIAGEDTELCLRLRSANWPSWRLNAEMTIHDAAITTFSQWWRRSVRCGYAFAQGAHLHGSSPERHFIWESRRARAWGIWIPLGCLGAILILGPWGSVTCLVYPLQVVRQIFRTRGSTLNRLTLGIFQVLARFPEAWGQIKFTYDRLARRPAQIIEYK